VNGLSNITIVGINSFTITSVFSDIQI
jgi:hypothetical protein